MMKPTHIYMFKFEDEYWEYCYYDRELAKKKALELALEKLKGHKLEDFYFDEPDYDTFLFYDGQDEDDDPVVSIHEYMMEDYDK